MRGQWKNQRGFMIAEVGMVVVAVVVILVVAFCVVGGVVMGNEWYTEASVLQKLVDQNPEIIRITTTRNIWGYSEVWAYTSTDSSTYGYYYYNLDSNILFQFVLRDKIYIPGRGHLIL